MSTIIKAAVETNTFEVFANGEFWGTWEAESEEEAINLAAEECGTDGNADGITARQISA